MSEFEPERDEQDPSKCTPIVIQPIVDIKEEIQSGDDCENTTENTKENISKPVSVFRNTSFTQDVKDADPESTDFIRVNVGHVTFTSYHVSGPSSRHSTVPKRKTKHKSNKVRDGSLNDKLYGSEKKIKTIDKEIAQKDRLQSESEDFVSVNVGCAFKSESPEYTFKYNERPVSYLLTCDDSSTTGRGISYEVDQGEIDQDPADNSSHVGEFSVSSGEAEKSEIAQRFIKQENMGTYNEGSNYEQPADNSSHVGELLVSGDEAEKCEIAQRLIKQESMDTYNEGSNYEDPADTSSLAGELSVSGDEGEKSDISQRFIKQENMNTDNEGSSSKKIHCPPCNEKFPRQRLKRTHEVMNKNKCLFKCLFCEKEFRRKSELTIHTMRQHTRERPHQCDFCEEAFVSISDLNCHKRLHRDKAYKCRFCDKVFTSKSRKVEHEGTHTGEKPFKCQYCEKHFSREYSRKDHERIHTNGRPYPCKFCEKRFRTRAASVRHERIHTGEKPYQCKVCEKFFTDQGALVRHERIHTGEKPYKCKFCEKCYTDLSGLVYHERLHTGETPYQCRFCEERFRHNTMLKNHEKKLHAQ